MTCELACPHLALGSELTNLTVASLPASGTAILTSQRLPLPLLPRPNPLRLPHTLSGQCELSSTHNPSLDPVSEPLCCPKLHLPQDPPLCRAQEPRRRCRAPQILRCQSRRGSLSLVLSALVQAGHAAQDAPRKAETQLAASQHVPRTRHA